MASCAAVMLLGCGGAATRRRAEHYLLHCARSKATLNPRHGRIGAGPVPQSTLPLVGASRPAWLVDWVAEGSSSIRHLSCAVTVAGKPGDHQGHWGAAIVQASKYSSHARPRHICNSGAMPPCFVARQARQRRVRVVSAALATVPSLTRGCANSNCSGARRHAAGAGGNSRASICQPHRVRYLRAAAFPGAWAGKKAGVGTWGVGGV